MKKALSISGTRERLLNLPAAMAFDSTCAGTASFEFAAQAVMDAIANEIMDPSRGDEYEVATVTNIKTNTLNDVDLSLSCTNMYQSLLPIKPISYLLTFAYLHVKSIIFRFTFTFIFQIL